MTPKLTEYIEAGKQLSIDERLEVAHQLLLSVQHDEGEPRPVGEAWETEILQRAKDALEGGAVLHDVGESHARLRAELAATRRK